MKDVLEKVISGQDLTVAEAQDTMNLIMSGGATPAQIGSLLTALRIKGESVDEISGFAKGMRHFSKKMSVRHELADSIVDTCGTGGDGANTFNISTASAIVTAAAGVPVTKHGNRAASSKTGSADVLQALGVNIELEPEQSLICLEETGLSFMYAVMYHESMRYAVGPRKELGFRTVFNMLGPLTNPANAKRQVIGTYSPSIVKKMAEVLNQLGSEHVMVVHGSDGLDELTVTGPSFIAELKNQQIHTYEISPEDVGLQRYDAATLKGGNPEENASIIRSVLEGDRGGPREIVLLNAGAAIYVAGVVTSLKAGVKLAGRMIDEGRALSTLQQLVQVSNRLQKETLV